MGKQLKSLKILLSLSQKKRGCLKSEAVSFLFLGNVFLLLVLGKKITGILGCYFCQIVSQCK